MENSAKLARQLIGAGVEIVFLCADVQSGTPEEIIGSSLYCLEYGGVDSGGYIFASSNCIFAGVPIESYNLMLEVRKRYGYPGAKRPKDKFALPQGL